MSEPRVVGRGVARRYGRAVALAGLDLTLAAGESLAVLGPNGAGKSTLLRLLAGLARPSEGEVEVEGAPAHTREARRHVGYIGHATLLYPELTPRENLEFTGRLHGLPDPGARAQWLLEETDLLRVADTRVAACSRGTAQRAAIARALVHEPSLLLLDEPFSGLDRSAGERLHARLAELRSDGRSLVLVTHEISHAARLCDRSLVLSGGHVVHEGRDEDGAALERAYLRAMELAA